jgi:hypothetical protein
MIFGMWVHDHKAVSRTAMTLADKILPEVYGTTLSLLHLFLLES